MESPGSLEETFEASLEGEFEGCTEGDFGGCTAEGEFEGCTEGDFGGCPEDNFGGCTAEGDFGPGCTDGDFRLSGCYQGGFEESFDETDCPEVGDSYTELRGEEERLVHDEAATSRKATLRKDAESVEEYEMDEEEEVLEEGETLEEVVAMSPTMPSRVCLGVLLHDLKPALLSRWPLIIVEYWLLIDGWLLIIV